MNEMQSTGAPRDTEFDDVERPAPLTAALAQRVVDQVAPRLSYGMNVMDGDGRIIGSVDESRIGTFHSAARQAIDECRTVAVTSADESIGVKPGVNIPLLLDGQVIGAVGITGDPATVEPVGAVIALTVELVVREQRQRDSSRWHEDAVRQVLLTLADRTISEAGLIEALDHLGSPLAPPWNITVAVSAKRSSATIPPEQLSALLRRLRSVPNVVGAELQGALWILSGSASEKSWMESQRRLGLTDVRVLRGRFESSVVELAVEVKHLRLLLFNLNLLPHHDVVQLTDLVAECATLFLPAASSRDLTVRILGQLSPALRETARGFLDNDLSIAATSKSLSMHRNTLVQRLERIDRLTGLDLRRFRHATTMRLALLAADAASDHPELKG